MTERNQIFSTQNLVLIAIAAALLAVCSWISFPIGVISVTLQTFGIFVVAGLLGLRRGTAAVFIYLLLGLIGLPVFSGFSGGITRFIPYTETGASGGYLLGFIFTAVIIGLFRKLAQKMSNQWLRAALLFAGMFLGDAVCFFFGTVWFVLFNPWQMNVAQALSVCVVPFIIPDLIKMLVALVVVERVGRAQK